MTNAQKQPTQLKTVALFDANYHGHHPTYLRLVSKLLLENDYKVWLFCQRLRDIWDWLRQNLEDPHKLDNLETFPIAALPQRNILTWWFWSARNWRNASLCLKQVQAIQGKKPDMVFFLKVDDFTKGFLGGGLVDYLFPYPWAGLYIHFKFPRGFLQLILNRICRPFSIFKSKRCIAIGLLQEDIVEDVQRRFKKTAVLFPDMIDAVRPTYSKLTDAILQRAKGRRIIGAIGGHDRRKGSFDLLEVAQRCRDREWFFLFAGKMNYDRSDNELRQLERRIGRKEKWENCFFHFEHIPAESDFNALVSLCDVIYAGYHEFPYSSNIMTKAAFYQKPIIVSAGTLMEKRVKEYGIGLSCPPGNIEAYSAAIARLLENGLNKPLYDPYLNNHSAHIFVDRIKSILEKNRTSSVGFSG